MNVPLEEICDNNEPQEIQPQEEIEPEIAPVPIVEVQAPEPQEIQPQEEIETEIAPVPIVEVQAPAPVQGNEVRDVLQVSIFLELFLSICPAQFISIALIISALQFQVGRFVKA